MTFVIADNDSERLNTMADLLTSAFPGSVLHLYRDPMLSAKCMMHRKVDAVFAEVQMQKVDGIGLLHVLRVNWPKLPVFLVSDTDRYKNAAASEGVTGYLTRPVTAEQLKRTVLEAQEVNGE
ncbi:MAG: response regulator [Faecousia sp.]